MSSTARKKSKSNEKHPLVEAFRAHNIPRFKTLAQQNPSSLDLKVYGHDGPLHSLLREASHTNDREELILFILWTYPPAAVTPTTSKAPPKDDATVGNEEAPSATRTLPLHLACSNKHVSLKVLQRLIDIFPKALQMTDEEGD